MTVYYCKYCGMMAEEEGLDSFVEGICEECDERIYGDENVEKMPKMWGNT